MEQLIELLQQIQDLAGVAIEALEGATEGGGEKPEGEMKPEGGEKPPAGEGGEAPAAEGGKPPGEKEEQPFGRR